jgi:hypothetical protein
VSGTASLTVTAATLQTITVAPASPSIAAGTTQVFTATGHYSDSSTQDLTATAAWKSSDTTIATMSGNVATGVKAGGPVTITATFSGVSGAASLTVTAATGGNPGFAGSILDEGSVSAGVVFVDLQIKNIGTGTGNSVLINQVLFRSASGTGPVTIDSSSPSLPIAIGNLAVGQTATVRLFLDVPANVTRFSMTENGTAQNNSGMTGTFSTSEVVVVH